jgi:hypothetical protein
MELVKNGVHGLPGHVRVLLDPRLHRKPCVDRLKHIETDLQP